MDTTPSFSADSDMAIWQQVATDMARQDGPFEYSAELHQSGYTIRFNLDIDLGGGFEGGYETTTFSAPVPGRPAFYFTLHEQDWVHEIGKLLGLTDVELGDAELDAAFIITTNDPAQLRAILADTAVRQTLLKYQELRLDLTPAGEELGAEVLLTFTKEQAVTEPRELQEIYHMLLTVLRHVAPLPADTAALHQ